MKPLGESELAGPFRRGLSLLVRYGLLLLAFGLAACADLPSQSEAVALARPSPQRQQLVPAQSSVPAGAGLRKCIGPYHASRVSGDFSGYVSVQQFIQRMVQQHGFDREYLNGLFSQAHRKNWTLEYFAKQDQTLKKPPRIGGWTKYRSQFLDDAHIGAGVEFARRYRSALQRASRQYGVPEEYILGILAVETTFGGNVGNHRVLDALTTLGFDYQRRGDFFRDELEKFLLMARQEGIDPAKPVGSFAGAMGLGQFMPSSFLRWAVDFDQDGRRDLWDPEDAIGSVANYFAKHGWRPGRPVATPLQAKGSVALETGVDTSYSLASLHEAGLKPARPCTGTESVLLLLLRHSSHDQYLIGHPNFYTITRYNHSTYYAMAVHELAQTFKQRL